MAGKMRSPNYPAIGLGQAVLAAKKLWDKERRTPISHETAAKALGYGSLSGPARVAIAALRQYGLVDKPDAGHVRLSDRAVRIAHGTPVEQEQALSEAAGAPRLFRELWTTHKDGSDDAIRSYLITKKEFSDEGAHKALKSWRDTLKLAKPTASGYTPSEDGTEDEEMESTETSSPTQNASKQAGMGSRQPEAGVFLLTVPFANGNISVQVRVTGDAMRPSHLARVRKYLELAESDWGTPDDEMGVPKAQ
ncbi:MAG: hypothetical protein ACRD2N_14250 [Vicinamibacterales bacterium]